MKSITAFILGPPIIFQVPDCIAFLQKALRNFETNGHRCALPVKPAKYRAVKKQPAGNRQAALVPALNEEAV